MRARTAIGLALTATMASSSGDSQADDLPMLVAAPKKDAQVIEATYDRVAPWADGLPALTVRNRRTGEAKPITLYRRDGTVDPDAATAFVDLAAKGGEHHALDTRVIQLVAKAAYHFNTQVVVIVSAYRPDKRGKSKHSTGEAVDFQLEGTRASILASYLRTLPRAGVGIYTHPRTQYVHLDVREQSFHWIDASPPGRNWREGAMRDPSRAERDAAYDPRQDLPINPS